MDRNSISLRKVRTFGLTLILLITIAFTGCVSPTQDELLTLTDQYPTAELTPLQVVQIQMDAFRYNDELNPNDKYWMTEAVQFISTTPPGERNSGNTAVGERSDSLYDS
jgi:hypothetical protein